MKKLSLIFLLLLNIVFSHVAYSQTEISGYIFDAKTKEPITYAHILIEGTNYGTYSSSMGAFKIYVPDSLKNSKLYISHITYENKYIIIKPNKSHINIELHTNTVTLGNIVIKPTKELKAKEIIKQVSEKLNSSFEQNSSTSRCFWRSYYTYHCSEQGKYNRLLVESLLDISLAKSLRERKKELYLPQELYHIDVIKAKSSDILSKQHLYYGYSLDISTSIYTINIAPKFLTEEYLSKYKYSFDETNNNNEVYVIYAKKKHEKAKIYIDKETLDLLAYEYDHTYEKRKYVNNREVKAKYTMLQNGKLHPSFVRITLKHLPIYIDSGCEDNTFNVIYELSFQNIDTLTKSVNATSFHISPEEKVQEMQAIQSLENNTLSANSTTKLINNSKFIKNWKAKMRQLSLKSYESNTNFWENNTILEDTDLRPQLSPQLLNSCPYPKIQEIFWQSYQQMKKIDKGKYQLSIQIESKRRKNSHTTKRIGQVFFDKYKYGLFGVRIRLHENDESLIFNSQKIYWIDHEEKSIMKGDLLEYDDFRVYENEMLFFPLLKTEAFFINALQQLNTFTVTQIANELIAGEDCWVFRLVSPQEQFVYHYYIRPKDYLLVATSTQRERYGRKEYVFRSIENLSKTLEDERVFEVSPSDIPDYTIVNYNDAKLRRRQDEKRGDILRRKTEAPDFELQTLEGKSIRLSDLRGKKVLLDFWFKGCYFCLKALPTIKKLAAKYPDLVVLGMNAGDSPEVVQEYVQEKQITYPTCLEAEKLQIDYRVLGFPTFVLIDEKGQVIFAQVGFSETLEKDLEKKIKK